MPCRSLRLLKPKKQPSKKRLADAAKELKKYSAPIIALTTQKTHDDHVAAHEAGCDTFVEKPIDPARLLEAVKWVLG